MIKAIKMTHSFDKDKIKRHFSGGLFLFVVIIAALWLFVSTIIWMTDKDRLPLSYLALEGKLKYITQNDIRGVIQDIDPMGTFMTQDVNELQEALLSLPWIEQVSIRKQWPETIKIFVVEHQVKATLNNEGLVDTHGDVFYAPVSDLSESKPALFGPIDKSKEMLDFLYQLQEKFNMLNIKVQSVKLTERLSWQLILDNTIRLELGRDAREERVNRFIELYKRLKDKDHMIDYIDLRYDTGAAVGWKTAGTEEL